MTRKVDCAVTRPRTSVGPDEAFELGIEVTFVNNALLCACVTAEVSLAGTVVDQFTVEVPIGGADNPTTASLTVPIDGAMANPNLPFGDSDVGVDIVKDEAGCGLFACDETAENGLLVRHAP